MNNQFLVSETQSPKGHGHKMAAKVKAPRHLWSVAWATSGTPHLKCISLFLSYQLHSQSLPVRSLVVPSGRGSQKATLLIHHKLLMPPQTQQ